MNNTLRGVSLILLMHHVTLGWCHTHQALSFRWLYTSLSYIVYSFNACGCLCYLEAICASGIPRSCRWLHCLWHWKSAWVLKTQWVPNEACLEKECCMCQVCTCTQQPCQECCIKTWCVCPQLFQFAHNHLRWVWGRIWLLSAARASHDGGD